MCGRSWLLSPSWRFLCRVVIWSLGVVVCAIFAPVTAQAQTTATCTSVAAGAVTVAVTGNVGTFTATVTAQLIVGDQLSFSTTQNPQETPATAQVRLIAGPVPQQTIVAAHTPPGGGTFPVQVTGTYQFEYQIVVVLGNERSKTVNFSANCVSAPRATLTLVKNVVNDNGGSAVDTDWTLNFAGPASGSGVEGAGSVTAVQVPVGIYALSESGPSGYSQTSISCTGTDTNGADGLTLSAGETVTCTFTNDDVVRAGSVTIIKHTVGGDGTFSFSSSNSAINGAVLSTSGGVATTGPIATTAGSFTVSEDDPAGLGFTLSSIQCVDPDGGTTVSVASRTASLDLDPGEAITCTFTNTEVGERTGEVIRRFLYQRSDLLLSEEPDRPRYVRKLPGSLWGNASGTAGTGSMGAPMNLMAAGNASNNRVAFSTSLSQIAAARRKANARKADEPAAAMGLGTQSLKDEALVAPPGVDVWVEGHYKHFDTQAGTSGHLGVLFVGTDYLLTPAILVGALVQFDWTEAESNQLTIRADGRGWMAGPYTTIRLSPNLFFDARAAWGQSDNSVSPFLTYSDDFDTDRWMARGSLTGNWHAGNWRITPSVSVAYFNEDAESYVDSNGVLIRSQSVSIGRLTFGPEIGYRLTTSDGTVIEPHISFEGLWDFDRENNFAIGGLSLTTDAFRGKIEGGVLIRSAGGYSMRGIASYDGIGADDFDAYGGEVWFNVPLN